MRVACLLVGTHKNIGQTNTAVVQMLIIKTTLYEYSIKRSKFLNNIQLQPFEILDRMCNI